MAKRVCFAWRSFFFRFGLVMSVVMRMWGWGEGVELFYSFFCIAGWMDGHRMNLSILHVEYYFPIILLCFFVKHI